MSSSGEGHLPSDPAIPLLEIHPRILDDVFQERCARMLPAILGQRAPNTKFIEKEVKFVVLRVRGWGKDN